MPRGGKRVGAGRKEGSCTAGQGMPTHVIRVSTEVPKELAQGIPELRALIDHYEEECLANPEVRTYDKLRKFIDEARALGF
jgi:hypothetical protein